MEKLRELRKAKKLTMKQLGQLVGASESTISLYERGLHDPDILTINRIADALGVTVDELLGREAATDQDLDDDTFALREQLRRDPDMRVLFSAASKATPEHIRAAAAMLKALRTGENNDTD